MQTAREKVAAELSAALDAKNISQRTQSGRSLSYIEAHHAIREANRIFGWDGWTRETVSVKEVQTEQKASRNGGDLWYIGYVCKVLVRVGEVVREGTGFGQGQDSDLGKAHESAIKEAESDAMKRALMTFGDPFGLALYDKTQEHVEKAPTGSRSTPQTQWGRDDAPKQGTARKSAGWTPETLAKILADQDVKRGELAIVLGPLTQNTYVEKINGWLADHEDESLNDLVAEVKRQREVQPSDLTPNADVRQEQMAGVN